MQELDIFNKNIISWYSFEKNKKILVIGNNECISNYLKEKDESVFCISNIEELNEIDEKFSYIIVYKYRNYSQKLTVIIDSLEEKGKLLIIDDNDFSINNWSKYDVKNELGISIIENNDNEKISINKIKKQLYHENMNHINTFFVFPNFENPELIINENYEIQKENLDKYTPKIESNKIRLFDEIKVLKNLVKEDKKLLSLFTNSYLLEVSKNEINNDIRYVSFNNARNEEYRLITIIRDDRVEKIPDNEKANIQIENMKKNIKEIKNIHIPLLDYEENDRIYSTLIKGQKTVDILLAEKWNNLDEVVKILKEMQRNLAINILTYEDIKEKIGEYARYIEEEKLKNLHFVKDAYIDMIAKNCFYINGEYTFFDQEWKEEYLPIEYITYRSIINSYDLIKKIDVNSLFKMLELNDYIELFENIDNNFRKKVINQSIFEKMYLNKDVKAVENLINDLKMYMENNTKQDQYIKALELDNKRKQEYIDVLEKNNEDLQKNIKKRRFF